MNARTRCLVLLLSLGMAPGGSVLMAQTALPRVVTCDTGGVPESALRLKDEASSQGALVEDVALVTLPNGMKSVQFSVRNTLGSSVLNPVLKVRYTVQWSDDCGRRIANGSRVVDGLILDRQRQQLVQSTAMDPLATRAFLRVYVEN